MYIPKPFQEALLRAFSKTPMWVVGGAVRDRQLGKKTTDFDFVLLKDPDTQARSFAKKINGSAFRLDDEFAITRVTAPNGYQFDFGRIQGKTLNADLLRRDFTINAMAVPFVEFEKTSWQKSLLDLSAGREDLKKRTIRAVSDGIFKNDPLRLLRAFRLSADLNFNLDSRTAGLIKKNRKLLFKSAPERIREEMLLLFQSPNSGETVEKMNQLGLLDILIPDAPALRKTGHTYYGKEGVLRHTLDSLHQLELIFASLNSWFPRCAKKVQTYLETQMANHPLSSHLKWAILLHDLGKPDTAEFRDGRLRFFEHEHKGADKIPGLAKRFRWGTDESRLYETMVRNHMRPGNLAAGVAVSDKAVHRFFRDLGEDAIGMLLVSLGDHVSYLTPRERKKRASAHEKLTIRMVQRFFLDRKEILPEKLVNGHDLMKALNVPPSPIIGVLLKEIMEAQAGGIVKTRDQALQLAKSRLPSVLKDVSK